MGIFVCNDCMDKYLEKYKHFLYTEPKNKVWVECSLCDKTHGLYTHLPTHKEIGETSLEALIKWSDNQVLLLQKQDQEFLYKLGKEMYENNDGDTVVSLSAEEVDYLRTIIEVKESV